MSTIVTRAAKGTPLTHNEVDANFTNLNTDKIESGNTVASLIITSATIGGGTINNTSIGGTTAASGSFTTLSENTFPVVSQTDIGTGQNQVPLNQYLGSFAYLDADNISFSNVGTNVAAQNLATNKLSKVTISADTTLTTTVPLVGSSAFVIIVTSGTTSRTVTFGTGFSATDTLATGTTDGVEFVVQFISDGTKLIEVCRNRL